MFLTKTAIRNMCQNPKGSNVYNTGGNVKYTTPMGSHFSVCCEVIYITILADCFSCDKLKEVVK